MSEFLESLRNKVDGPKLPFHIDYARGDFSGRFLAWVVAEDAPDTHYGLKFVSLHPTIKEAEAERDRLNKLFRDEGAGGESLSTT